MLTRCALFLALLPLVFVVSIGLGIIAPPFIFAATSAALWDVYVKQNRGGYPVG